MRILVVEDDLETMYALKAVLTSEHHEVWCAGNLDAGIELAKARAYHLCIVDYKLRGERADPIFQWLTGKTVVISASQINEDVILNQGINRVLYKPFSICQLLSN